MSSKRAHWRLTIRLSLLGILLVTTGVPAIPTAATRGPAQARRAYHSAPLGRVAQSVRGQTTEEIAELLGIPRPSGKSPTDFSLEMAQALQAQGPASASPGPDALESGLPKILSDRAAFSTALFAAVGGRNSLLSEADMLADLDGREDLTADHSNEVVDVTSTSPITGSNALNEWMLTRVAQSEHTLSNGYTTTVFYMGDSVGNVYVGVDGVDADFGGQPLIDSVVVLNLPTILNAFGSLLSDDQIVITGLGINPVADLTSFANVNGSFAPFAGQIGEILYVSFWDTGAGFRLAANNVLIRSGVLAFPIADTTSITTTPPGIQSPLGFPVTVGGAFGVAFSVFGNLAGLAIDDAGSVYFQQVDLIQFSGANIVKIESLDRPFAPGYQDRSLATNGILTISTLNPAGGNYGTTSGPINQQNRFTNYSGTALTFGNVSALAAGPDGALYAAVARSHVATDDAPTQATEGIFANPAALGDTPAMVISLADNTGAFEICTSITQTTTGTVPIADGFADVVQPGLTRAPGANNFRAFVLGNGPDIRGSAVAPSSLLKLDMQVDYTIFSGLAVDEANQVYVVSGGTPAGVGRDPSPTQGEVLLFPDSSPADRQADFVDLRGNNLPNPPLSGGNVGDGDSDRFDHIFWVAPIDQVSVTPVGVAGLSRGFLVYTNRRRGLLAAIANLPNGAVQGDDDTDGPIVFEQFDPSHQVAGGDDQNPPFRGDDDDGAGSPITATALSGGFEFVLGTTSAYTGSVWNAFYLNSNGSVTFGSGDTDNSATAADLIAGAPRLAGAWMDLNPSSRVGGYTNTFPVQAAGFAAPNHFKVRWIDVPEFGYEACGSRNNFSISLFDDGNGYDENENQPLNPANPIGNNAVPFDEQEGSTDLHFWRDPGTGLFLSQPSRPQGSGQFCYDYGRMDVLGLASDAVVTGFSVGGLPPGPPAETNLSAAGVASDALAFPNLTGIIGDGSQHTIYETFDAATPATGSSDAVPDYDLRFEGNHPLLGKPANQADPNRDRLCFFGATPRVTPVITLTTSPNPSLIGQVVTLTATFAPPPGTNPTTFPSGLFVVKLDGAPFFANPAGTGLLVPTAAIPAGLHSLSVEYSGDGRYNPAVSNTVVQDVHALLFLALVVR